MPAKKLPFDELSESSQERYVRLSEHPWSLAWDEDINDVSLHSKWATTPRVFLYALPIMRQARGYLERNGRAVTSADLSRMMDIPQVEIGKSLTELYSNGIFDRRADKAYCYPKMVAFFRKKKGKTSTFSDQTLPSYTKEDSQPGKIREGDSQNEASQIIIDERREDERSESSSSKHLNNIKGEADRPGSGGASPSADSPIGIASVFKVPGATFADDVTQQWLAGVKAWAKYKPLARRHAEIVTKCVQHWTDQGKQVTQAMIFNSLNHALGKSADPKSAAKEKAKEKVSATVEKVAEVPTPKTEINVTHYNTIIDSMISSGVRGDELLERASKFFKTTTEVVSEIQREEFEKVDLKEAEQALGGIEMIRNRPEHSLYKQFSDLTDAEGLTECMMISKHTAKQVIAEIKKRKEQARIDLEQKKKIVEPTPIEVPAAVKTAPIEETQPTPKPEPTLDQPIVEVRDAEAEQKHVVAEQLIEEIRKEKANNDLIRRHSARIKKAIHASIQLDGSMSRKEFERHLIDAPHVTIQATDEGISKIIQSLDGVIKFSE